jgi:hypothetical protein
MAIVRGQKRRVTTGQEGAVGQVAVTRTPLTPKELFFTPADFGRPQLKRGGVRREKK